MLLLNYLFIGIGFSWALHGAYATTYWTNQNELIILDQIKRHAF